MNAAEEHAILELAYAETVDAKRAAIRTFQRGKGVRLSEAARGKLASMTVERAVPLRASRIDDVDPLEHGPEPVLDDDTRETLVDWSRMWMHVERFPSECKPGGLLLHGPTGTGKTTAARWLSALLGDRYPGHLLEVHSVVRSHLGETGGRLSSIFRALNRSPGVLVIEEIDAMAAVRGGGSSSADEVSRITVALMRLIEAAKFPVIATTNRRDALDSALLRRFDAHVLLDEPTPRDKINILEFVGVDPSGLDLSAPVSDLVRAAKTKRRRCILDEALGEAKV